MSVIAIIPARMGSSRFPGKPLAMIAGIPMIEHVRRRTQRCVQLDNVYVATCDEEIRQVVEASDGAVIATKPTHTRCLDRVAEAAGKLLLGDDDIVMVVQGDEPLVMPDMLTRLIETLLTDHTVRGVIGIARIETQEDFFNPNTVKVVISADGHLLYQSRAPIPYDPDGNERIVKRKQLGLYAFWNDVLQKFAALPSSQNELNEASDLNRAVDHGMRLRCLEIEGTMWGVDVPDDIRRIESILAHDPLVAVYRPTISI